MKKILLSMFAMLTMGISTASADELNLSPSDATYINAGNPETNYSGGVLYANFSKISGGKLTDQLSAYGGSDITIVKFDASSLPSDATVTAASMTFKSKCTVAGKNSQLAVVPIGTEWDASTATWANMDLSANGASKVDLEYSAGETDQTYDAKTILTNDEDKVLAFAIFTNTGRQQEIYDLALTIEYTLEAITEHDYTVNAVAGTEILKTYAKGKAYENDTYSVSGLSYAINKDGVIYKLDDTSVANYSKTFTMGTEDATESVQYTEASDIAYFFEAESILSRSYGNPNGDYSGGTSAAIYSGANLTMANIAAGAYTITINSSVRRSNEDILNVQISTDGETTWEDAGTITLTSNVGGDYSADVTLSADGSIRLVEGKNQNFFHYVDYIIVKKAVAASAEMVITDAKYATFCAPFEVIIPTGVTASKVSGVAESEITLEEVSGTIPANTPVVLYAESAFSTTVSGVAVAGTPTAGLLTGVYEETTVTTGSYVLQNQDGKVAFYLVNPEIKVPANRAYLTVASSASGAKAINFPAATAIKAIEALTSGSAKIYDVNGREINKLQKGINIVNGVKVMVK